MLYRWSLENCPSVKYILKADDDTFVDTFHLPTFLQTHNFDLKENFFLCFVLKGYKPRRNKGDKWYITREQYDKDEYPPYCSGSVYITKIQTIRKILPILEKLNYLYIDDLLVTGIAAKGVTAHYDWSKSFLESHTDSSDALLSPHLAFYTPELLAAMNLNATSILQLHKKANKCFDEPKCYSLLNLMPIDHMKPKEVSKILHLNTEL